MVSQDGALALRAKRNPAMLQNMEKGVSSALESVIPEAALHPFLLLNDTEKVTQLTELSNLVLGIRLFNKEVKSRGDLLHDTDYLLSQLSDEFIEQIKQNISEVIQLVEDYTNYLKFIEKTQTEEKNKKILIEELIFLRQYLNLSMVLLDKIESSFGVMETSARRYAKEINELKHFLGSKTSAPKDQVYPKFTIAASSYVSLCDESRRAQDKKNTFEVYLSFFEKLDLSLTEAHIETARRYAEEENFEKENSEKSEEFESRNNVVFIEPRHSQDYLDLSLDLMGYCPVTLVEQQGLLLPGKHALGVLRFKNKFFVFKSKNCIKKFFEDPDRFLDQVYNQCRINPALILLLNEESYFTEQGLELVKFDESTGTASKVMVDKNLETPVHIIEKFLDKDYCWDEWELRKKAIQMANIRNMTTKSTQTDDSIFKVENETQVWLKKEAATMTGVNSGSNPIRPRNYITELRDKAVQ